MLRTQSIEFVAGIAFILYSIGFVIESAAHINPIVDESIRKEPAELNKGDAPVTNCKVVFDIIVVPSQYNIKHTTLPYVDVVAPRIAPNTTK